MTSGRPIAIREAGVDDASVVYALIARMSMAIPSHFSLRSSAGDFEQAMAADPPAIRALLAENDGDAVGVLAFFTTFSTWYGTPGIYVQDIYVDESARAEGIGHNLLAAACAWGVAHGADHLRLSVDRVNRAAQAFYTDHGLSYCDDEKIYMIEGDAFRKLGAES